MVVQYQSIYFQTISSTNFDIKMHPIWTKAQTVLQPPWLYRSGSEIKQGSHPALLTPVININNNIIRAIILSAIY